MRTTEQMLTFFCGPSEKKCINHIHYYFMLHLLLKQLLFKTLIYFTRIKSIFRIVWLHKVIYRFGQWGDFYAMHSQQEVPDSHRLKTRQEMKQVSIKVYSHTSSPAGRWYSVHTERWMDESLRDKFVLKIFFVWVQTQSKLVYRCSTENLLAY